MRACAAQSQQQPHHTCGLGACCRAGGSLVAGHIAGRQARGCEVDRLVESRGLDKPWDQAAAGLVLLRTQRVRQEGGDRLVMSTKPSGAAIPK